MKKIYDYIIQDFINDRVKYFNRLLNETKCINFTKEQKDFLSIIYKNTLHPFYFDNLKKELLECEKTTIRVELLLVDK